MKKFRLFITIFILYVIFCMVISPSKYIQCSLNGLKAWAFNVLPSVLPFIFLTKVLSSFGYMQSMSKIFSKPFYNLYKTPSISSFVFLMSIISGYPVGAKLTADLYQNRVIKKSDAFKMTSFCSTSGPMFIIGAVGSGMLLSAKAGYIIFIAHVIGALLNGLLYRNIKLKNDTTNQEALFAAENKFDISQTVTDSALSIICVGTIITIFFILIESLSPFISVLPTFLQGGFEGLIEITRGCIDIAATLSTKPAILLCTFVISFGGLSTILQSITMLNKLEMPISLFILQKFTHAVFASIVAGFFVLLI